ncbi:hypothetical protein ACJJIK_15070 [Microbulbifer sp. ZKSA006]|uniref:hypothetical protein n=1 Tax=Microbulbifer sp. ZKSA006 TaxID=3243390 RepID=UPI0040395A87
MSDYLKIIENGELPNINRNVWVPSSGFDAWKEIKKGHQSNYYMCKLTRALYDIAIKPGPRSFSNPKTLTLNGAQIHYSILECGDVVVDRLIEGNFPTPEEKQDTGLYYVYYDQISDSFKTSNSPKEQLPYNHQWDKAHYVAVSGKFKNKEEAGWELIEHIRKAYESSVQRYLRNQLSDESHYALFWQDGRYYDSKNAQSLAAWIAHGQGHCMPINWLVHGEGTGTFVKALELLIKQPGIHPFKGDNGKLANQNTMARQQVFFSNPRGPNGGSGITEKKLKKLCEQAGIHMSGININPLDVFHNRDARMKGLNTVANITAGTATIGGLAGLESEVGFAKVKRALEMTQDLATAVYTRDASHLSLHSVAGVTAACITGFACAKKTYTIFRNAIGTACPTKKNGDNRYWAEKKS